jgi:hypothetical protein
MKIPSAIRMKEVPAPIVAQEDMRKKAPSEVIRDFLQKKTFKTQVCFSAKSQSN